MQHIIERETAKPRDNVFTFFVDLEEAFDKVARTILWRTMVRRGVNREIIERIKEIFKETEIFVRIGETLTESFWTAEGVRQGCPLSPTLFTIYISEMEEAFRKGQGGGIVVGNFKVWSLPYADDIVVISNKEEELKAMMKRLEYFLDMKKLNLYVEKAKTMVFQKGGGKEKTTSWNWKGERVEEVKEMYVRIKMQRNGDPINYIKERMKRANVVIKQVRGMGERKFQDGIQNKDGAV